jgi:hypothetical protein
MFRYKFVPEHAFVSRRLGRGFGDRCEMAELQPLMAMVTVSVIASRLDVDAHGWRASPSPALAHASRYDEQRRDVPAFL